MLQLWFVLEFRCRQARGVSLRAFLAEIKTFLLVVVWHEYNFTYCSLNDDDDDFENTFYNSTILPDCVWSLCVLSQGWSVRISRFIQRNVSRHLFKFQNLIHSSNQKLPGRESSIILLHRGWQWWTNRRGGESELSCMRWHIRQERCVTAPPLSVTASSLLLTPWNSSLESPNCQAIPRSSCNRSAEMISSLACCEY